MLRLPTITHERLDYMTFKNGMRPVHPGEVLREEYLKPLDLSANALAKALRLSPSRIGDIVLERRGVTADTAVRLARYFGGTAQFWLNYGGTAGTRTQDQSLKRALLYQLSYRPNQARMIAELTN
jgi:addiction module HigA family antidote